MKPKLLAWHGVPPERSALEAIKRRGAPYLQWAGKAGRPSFEVGEVKLCNLRVIVAAPPTNCSAEREQANFEWAVQVVGGVRGAHRGLEAVFDGIHARSAEFAEVVSDQGV